MDSVKKLYKVIDLIKDYAYTNSDVDVINKCIDWIYFHYECTNEELELGDKFIESDFLLYNIKGFKNDTVLKVFCNFYVINSEVEKVVKKYSKLYGGDFVQSYYEIIK